MVWHLAECNKGFSWYGRGCPLLCLLMISSSFIINNKLGNLFITTAVAAAAATVRLSTVVLIYSAAHLSQNWKYITEAPHTLLFLINRPALILMLLFLCCIPSLTELLTLLLIWLMFLIDLSSIDVLSHAVLGPWYGRVWAVYFIYHNPVWQKMLAVPVWNKWSL